ncbi:hypothetical protein [Streptomyces aidingensis]|uniref:Protein-L-isoaspartate(D-aspartate) O-methyltransferase n=1 Tax=Streptomyces aidingensis TaxID=910347 RepID=A0A1I1GYQ2_9ACTN|nr:hypothetical protein [Streptomyces aidingensis]SFC16784.1 protein-L-isoaspartate(D-aspartate) O-methyltransferase [Streptomyces aidingensis]
MDDRRGRSDAAPLWPDAIGVILADHPRSPSLKILRCWIAEWHHGGRPDLGHFTPVLVPTREENPDGDGWHLRLARR